MWRIRAFEERVGQLTRANEVHGLVHLSTGQEAVAVGVCSQLRDGDYVAATYRGHGAALALGVPAEALAAELMGRTSGVDGGRGGSMNVIDIRRGLVGCFGIVGGSIGAATGAALSAKRHGGVAVAFFGDGATNQAYFHECLNFAVVRDLPVLFVCENNLYSVNTPLDVRQPGNRTIAELARGHGIRTSQHDGQSVEIVEAVAADVIAGMRKNGGPALLEFITYRWLEHCGPLGDLHLGYRSQAEFDSWSARCPIRLYREVLEEDGMIDEAAHAAMDAEIAAEIDDAVAFARKSPFPERTELSRHMFA